MHEASSSDPSDFWKQELLQGQNFEESSSTFVGQLVLNMGRTLKNPSQEKEQYKDMYDLGSEKWVIQLAKS